MKREELEIERRNSRLPSVENSPCCKTDYIINDVEI